VTAAEMAIVVSDSDVKAFIIAANSFSFEKLSVADFDKFLYEGFDPWRILEELTKVKNSKSISDEEMGRDMAFVVGISIITGAPVEDKIKTKMSEEGQRIVKDLAVKWGINWGGGKGKGARFVNFPRIALALPIVTIKIINIIGPKEFPNEMSSQRLPKCMQHPCFPSIIPNSLHADVKRMLLNASLCYGIDMSISLQNIEKPDPSAVASKQKPYIRSSNSSRIPEESDRRVFFKILNLKTEYPIIKEVLDVYIAKVDSAYACPDETLFITTLSY
jgi:hypothetical protein